MKRVLIISLVSLAAVVSGCTKWLDVKDETKKLEKDLYQTEEGIDGALNGLYREMMSNNLYGGRMNGDIVDLLAHYYDVPRSSNDRLLNTLRLVGNYDYTNADVRGQFDAVWNNGYTFILHTNIFIDNMMAIEGQGILSENNRKLFLGEAIALRAMMHLDLYRLYGPVKPVGTAGVLPYHDVGAITLPDYSSPTDFLGKVMADLEKADALMINTDPIKVDSKKYDGADDGVGLEAEERFAKVYRNKRMNYWAVQVLKMRVHMLLGTTADYQAAVTIGRTVLDANLFNLTPNISASNAMAYSEIIMGVSKVDASSWWKTYFEQSTAGANTRVITEALLWSNLWGANPVPGNDKRLEQFKPSGIAQNMVGGYPESPYQVSEKYKNPTRLGQTTPGTLAYNMRDLRGLIRITEVHYTIIEAMMRLDEGNKSNAITGLNNVLGTRGFLPRSPGSIWQSTSQMLDTDTVEELNKMMKMEWYREFVGEGQTWFYLKRNEIVPFSANDVGDVPYWNEANWVWVRPEGETDFDKKE